MVHKRRDGFSASGEGDINGEIESEIPYILGFEDWMRFMTALMLMILSTNDFMLVCLQRLDTADGIHWKL
jgi:hypothetical protein